jgi:predicted  nucleic acid-binding Zn-ribbon protein
VRHGLLCLLVVALGACGSPEPDRVPGPETLEDEAPALVDPVSVDADGFDPAEVDLDTSEAFELTNTGDEPVRVVGLLDDDQRYDTGSLLPDESVVIAFREEGEYVFSVDSAPDADTLVVRAVLDPAAAQE